MTPHPHAVGDGLIYDGEPLVISERIRLPMICVCDPGRKADADERRYAFEAAHAHRPVDFLTAMAYALDEYHAWVTDVLVDQWCGVTVRQVLYARTPDGRINDEEDAPEPSLRTFYIECDRLEDGLVSLLGELQTRKSDPEDPS